MSNPLASGRPAERLPESPFDVLIIGGGIVGAGVARDAALRGLRVGLVEQQDFSEGTSSRSSRLLHGGIRYLAQGRVGLVREANREKSVIRRIAPHLAMPLAFIFPARRGSGWHKWQLSLGVKLYDLLCGRERLGRSRTLSRDELLSLLPGHTADGLTGGVRYFDALTNDARLVIDTLRSAANHGALAYNRVAFRNASADGQAWRCELHDRQREESFEVSARCIVNAAGPWSDRIPGAKTSLRLTKGVHVVVERSRLPVPDAVVVPEGKRILFVIPWGERVILGTTDTDYEGPLETPHCTAKDRDYVLDAINRAFPEAELYAFDVLSTWAGLRPLVADARGRPSDISRRHVIAMSRPGWWDVTGGKLTTYRLMAEETVDRMAEYLGKSLGNCVTATRPLLEDEEPAPGAGLLPPPIDAELVQHYCEAEGARHLDDVMIRRTSWHYYHRDRSEIARRVAEWMAGALDWPPDVVAAELTRYDALTSSAEATEEERT